jgi:acyl-homoserine lactone acylase PvdQ
MAPDGQNFRALSAAALLEKTNQITIEKMISEVGYDHYLAAFDSLLPPLFAAFNEASPGDDLKKSLASPIECLSAWNKYASDTSIATTLAIEWAYRLRSKAPAARSSESSSDIVALVQAMVKNSSGHEKLLFLADVITVLEQKFGSWKIAWGKINRYQRTEGQVFSDTEKSFAVGLAPGTWGCIPSFSGDYFPGTKLRYGTSGNSFVACVEFGKKLRARTVITGGQSFHKDSIHFTDQVNNYIQGNFKEVLFYKADVLKAAVRTYRLDE